MIDNHQQNAHSHSKRFSNETTNTMESEKQQVNMSVCFVCGLNAFVKSSVECVGLVDFDWSGHLNKMPRPK